MFRRFMTILFCIFLFPLSFAPAEESFSVSLPGTVKGYTSNEITVLSPEAGEAEFRLYDVMDNLWLTRRESLSAGGNRLTWDGLGENQERLFAGPYRFDAILYADSGGVYTARVKFEVSGTVPALVYALPSSDTLYLDTGRWFTEVFVSAECYVIMEVRNAKGEKIFSREQKIANPDGESVKWSGTVSGKKKIAPGQYIVTFRSKPNPAYESSFPLRVEETAPPAPEVAETGPVIPERGMSDEEIWEIMTRPSVVINENGSSKRIDLYPGPRVSNRPAGTLCCATQALEVLGFEGAWAHVRAWSHTDGKPVEGYIQKKRLAVTAPNGHYGILVDKREQKLTVFMDGKRIGTVPVSTGKVVGHETYRETPAGAFLTDVRFGSSFAQEGFRYEYPIRYDGGNIIHGVGFTRDGRGRDYSRNHPLLGQKASHGCIRVSSFIGEDSPVNMYWLWLRLPYHTRVVILDD